MIEKPVQLQHEKKEEYGSMVDNIKRNRFDYQGDNQICFYFA